MLLAAVLWEDAEAINQAKQLLHNFLTIGSVIPANLREVCWVNANWKSMPIANPFQLVSNCRWCTLVLCYPVNTHFGSIAGKDTYRYEALQKEPQNVYNCCEPWEKPKMLGKSQFHWENNSTNLKKNKINVFVDRFQNRLLSHVITLPPTEVVQVLQAIAGTPTGGAMACRFLQAKWYDLESKMGAGSVNFAKVISAITQYGATKFDYDEVCRNVFDLFFLLWFWNKRLTRFIFLFLLLFTMWLTKQLKSLVHRFGSSGPGMRTLNMTLKSVAANVEWVSRSQNAIFNWVESHENVGRRR